MRIIALSFLSLFALTLAARADDEAAPSPPAGDAKVEAGDPAPAGGAKAPAADAAAADAADATAADATVADGDEGGGGEDPKNKNAEPQGLLEQLTGGGMMPIIMLLVLGLLFYFVMLRPRRKEQNELKKSLESLKKNDRIETIGGICGTVAAVSQDSKYVTIKIDDGTNAKMKVLRNAVARVVSDDGGDDKKKEDKSDDKDK